MSTDIHQQVKDEWARLATVQQFLPTTVLEAITQRTTKLLEQNSLEPVTSPTTLPVQASPRPLVKRLGTTPQPLSDLFIIH